MKYEYDGWGNIQRKLEYAYTTSEQLLEPQVTVTITFNGNPPLTANVTNLPGNLTVVRGSTITLPSNVPQLNCSPYVYSFLGWSIRANGIGTNYRPGQTITVNSNLTLYAKWQLIYAPPGGGEVMGGGGEVDSIDPVDGSTHDGKPADEPTKSGIYPKKTYVYRYDANWKDKLTSIESYDVDSTGLVSVAKVNIPYDSMGNPTKWNLTKDLVWEGKQLTTYVINLGVMTGTMRYTYDENGLRTSKSFMIDSL